MSIPDLTLLKAKLTADYDGTSLTPNQIAAELNDATGTHKVTQAIKLDPEELMFSWMGAGGRYQKLLTAAEDGGQTDQTRSICWAMLKACDSGANDYDISAPNRLAAINALVAATVLSAADKTALVAVAAETVSWAEDNGYGQLRQRLVMYARQ